MFVQTALGHMHTWSTRTKGSRTDPSKGMLKNKGLTSLGYPWARIGVLCSG